MTWLHTTHAFVGKEDIVLHVSAKLRDARSLAHIRDHLQGATPTVELTLQSPLLLVTLRFEIGRVEALIGWPRESEARFASGGALTWHVDGLTIDEARIGAITITQIDITLIHDVMRSLECEHRQRVDRLKLRESTT